MITEFAPGRVRFDRGGVPVGIGDQELGVPTKLIRTPEGNVWAVYAIGEQALVVHPGGAIRGRPDEVSDRLARIVVDEASSRADRRAAATMLELVSASDDPGSAAVPKPYGERVGVPRSTGETGLPATYPLSGPFNRPGQPNPEAEPPPPRPAP